MSKANDPTSAKSSETDRTTSANGVADAVPTQQAPAPSSSGPGVANTSSRRQHVGWTVSPAPTAPGVTVAQQLQQQLQQHLQLQLQQQTGMASQGGAISDFATNQIISLALAGDLGKALQLANTLTSTGGVGQLPPSSGAAPPVPPTMIPMTPQQQQQVQQQLQQVLLNQQSAGRNAASTTTTLQHQQIIPTQHRLQPMQSQQQPQQRAGESGLIASSATRPHNGAPNSINAAEAKNAVAGAIAPGPGNNVNGAGSTAAISCNNGPSTGGSHSTSSNKNKSTSSKKPSAPTAWSNGVGATASPASQHGNLIPCRARGMPMAHNFQTAYFKLPENVKHGQGLICSFPACRDRGIKFLYCIYCRDPVAKRNFRNKHQHEDLVEKSKLAKATTSGGNGTCSHRDSKSFKSVGDSVPTKRYNRKMLTSNDTRSARNEQSSRIEIGNRRSSSVSSPDLGSTVHVRGGLASAELSSHEEMVLMTKFGPEKKAAWTRLLLNRPDNDKDDEMSKWLMRVMFISDVKKSYSKKGRKRYHEDQGNDSRHSSSRRCRRRKEPNLRRKRGDDDDDGVNGRPYNTLVGTSVNNESDESTGLSSLEAGETNEDFVENDENPQYLNNSKNAADQSDSYCSSSQSPVVGGDGDDVERQQQQQPQADQQQQKDSLQSNGSGGDGVSKDVSKKSDSNEVYGSSRNPTDAAKAIDKEVGATKAFVDA